MPAPLSLEDLVSRLRTGGETQPDPRERWTTLASLVAPKEPKQPRLGGGGRGGLDELATGRISTDVLMPNDPLLVTRHGDTLQQAAMKSILGIKRQLGLGGRIWDVLGSTYRTPEQQTALYAQKPGLAAPPGQSLHQRGLAVDLVTTHPLFEKVRQAMRRSGWNQFDASLEPWHLSYRETG